MAGRESNAARQRTHSKTLARIIGISFGPVVGEALLERPKPAGVPAGSVSCSGSSRLFITADDFGHLEDGQEHTNDHAADDDAQENDQDWLD